MPLDWNKVKPGPRTDEIEICVFGPGYGESIALHVGSGRWVVVDSCVDKASGEPAPLAYLQAIGVNPASAVDLVIATHWHDDHVRGLAKVLEQCASAQFCCAKVFATDQFLKFVARILKRNTIAGGAGIEEFGAIIDLLQARKATVLGAGADRRVRHYAASALSHGQSCGIWTLSPSDLQYTRFLTRIGVLLPQVGQTKYRATSEAPNDFCAAVLVEWDNTSALLGADLERGTNPGLGWPAVVSSLGRPTGKSAVFKVAHHGSKDAHYDPVWDQMLHADSLAALTPYNKGHKLPTRPDVTRIYTKTTQAFITAGLKTGTPKRRDASVERSIREANIRISMAEPEMGLIRLRHNAAGWAPTLFNQAMPLRELFS